MLYVVSAPSSIPSPSPHPKSVRIRGSIDLTPTPRAAAVVAASNVYCPEMCSLCSCRRRRRFGGFQGLPTRGNANMAVRFVNARSGIVEKNYQDDHNRDAEGQLDIFSSQANLRTQLTDHRISFTDSFELRSSNIILCQNVV